MFITATDCGADTASFYGTLILLTIRLTLAHEWDFKMKGVTIFFKAEADFTGKCLESAKILY